MKHSPLVVLLIALSLVAAACSSSSASTQLEGGADAAVCADLQSLGTAARKAAALGSFSTRDDARRAASSLQRSLDHLRLSAAGYPDIQLDPLESAIDDFSTTARKASSGITLGSSSGDLQTGAMAIGRLRAALSNTLNCP